MRETTSIEFERVDLAPGDHAAEVGGLVGVDRIVVHDVQRVAALAHVQAGERAPGAADRIEGPARAAGQHMRFRQRLGGDLLGLLDGAVGGFLEPDAAQREALASPRPVVADVDHLDRTATEVAGYPVGLVEAGDDALRGEPRFLAAGENGRLDAGDRFHRGDEIGAVGGVAHGGRRQDVQRGHADLPDQRGEAADGGQRRGDRFRFEPAARRQAAPEPAQFLFVEQRGRRAGEPFVDDETHRVRADVDNRDRPAAVEASRRIVDDGEFDCQLTPPDRAGAPPWACRFSGLCHDRKGSDWS